MINLDLRNLTQAHIDEALPHIGGCRYNDPCIIGTLIPVDQRKAFDTYGPEGPSSVENLIDVGQFRFPEGEQEWAASEIQEAFDGAEREWFLELVQPWLEAEPVQ